MFRRQMSKLPPSPFVLFLFLFYFTLYVLISYFFFMQETKVTFVSDALRIGDKYALIFLVAPGTPMFNDSEAADVFTSRRCGRCIVTNNKGFLPMNLYDAVLIYQESKWQETALIQPDKLYKLEASSNCIRGKMRNCRRQLKVVSLSGQETFDLCSFCDHLTKKV